MASTRDNPGASHKVSVRGLGGIASKALRLLRKGDYPAAALSTMTDAINLFEHKVGSTRAKRFRCTCCGHEAHAFRHVLSGRQLNWNSACPSCDSRSRHRGLAKLLPQLLDQHHPRTVLHFAPEPVLRRCFARDGLVYETADLFLEDATHRGVDLQNLPFSDGSYDFVVCNHVLEHVQDDAAAVREISRVLSPAGVAVITVPGDFGRRQTIPFEGELPNGHYRDYGLDLVEVLQGAFRKVGMIDMNTLDRAPEGLSHAIRRLDMAFVCER